MAYTKTTWANTPSTGSPINATNLNNMETGIETLDTGKLNISAKAIGTDISTGTNDDKYVTSKAIKDADLNTRLKSKIITATRDGQGNTGDVSYTGVGFTPTSIRAIMAVDGTLYQSDGNSDSAKTSFSIYQTAANVYYNNTSLVTYSNQSAWIQGAIVKSYDADGFTLTWTKAGTPTANTMQIRFICYR